MQEADPIESYRLQANLKSIHRSDTAVQAILSSSNYATIYHYEQDAGPTGEGEWVKQKAEGPLFVVQRNTSPEHAIFMLNRQTVKNVTIPLVRGEMKVTAVGAGMLQIARRGEKVRRGVWFSEGEGTVERFRQTILQICGEPSARPATTQANANPATVNAQGGVPPVSNTAHDASSSNGPALGAADAGQDGLSRLFAGLMPTATSNQSAGQSGSNGSNSQLPMSNVPPAPQEQQAPTVQEHQPIQTKSPSPAPPPAPAQSFHRPGETVDDLLNSILGIGGAGKGMGANRPPVAQSAPPMPVPGNLTNAGVTQPRPDAPHHQSSFGAVPDRAQTPSHPTPPEFLHVGTASPFPSGPGPAGPGPNRSQSPFVHNGPSPAHHAVGSPLVNGTGKGQQRPNGVSDQIPHQVAPNSQQGPPMPGLNMAHQLNNDCTDRGVVARTAVVDVLGRAMPDMRQGGKEGLAKTVAALIANEPRFVDDLWEAYIRRLGGTPG